MATIKELSKEERPREKLLDKGADALSTPELLAIFLRTGNKGKSAIDLGRDLLSHFGSLKNIFTASKEQLLKVKGVKGAKIAAVMASIELAKRYLKENGARKKVITKPQDVYTLYHADFIGISGELFKVLYLNARNEIIGEESLGSSTASSCLCHPQEFLRGLVQCGASRMILIHNHPSGDTKPSRQDISFTAELKKHLEYFGFELLDHVIIAGESFVSLKESGNM